jgi:hypothetical protein
VPYVPRFAKKTRAKWRSEARTDTEAAGVLKNLGERIRVLRGENQLREQAYDLARTADGRSYYHGAARGCGPWVRPALFRYP